MRWITNAFYTTNISVLSSEACLAPMALYTEQIRLMAAVRIVTAIPKNNVATAMLPQSFPIKGDFRLSTNRREAFDKNRGGMRPKVWSSKCNTTAQVRLPIDEISARATEIFPIGPIPMRPTRLLRVTPEDAEGYFKAKETVQKNIHKKWPDELYPLYYEYMPPYMDCWNFRTLPKFAAGSILQIRTNKSYLKAQTDWSNEDQDPRCLRSKEESETMPHIHQHKRTLRLIRRRCVLTQATHLLRPMRPVRPDLRCNAPPHPTLPDATWQRSLRPDATWRPPYVWTTPDSFSHLFFLLMRR